ncbi:MAG: hypothetical protein AB1806_02380 [Acidobacteriota bacterium]
MTKTSAPRVLATLALVVLLAGAMQLVAAATAEAQDNYKTLARLGSASRFDRPIRDAAALQKWASSKAVQGRLGTVMDKAGLAALTPTVIDILTKADPAQLKETVFEPGGTMVWMAFRRGGRTPDIVRNIRWGGKKGFDGWTFVIDDMVQTYTFVLPKICANIALVSAEPSREKARLDAERAEKERLERERIERERAAERARLEAERREKERLEKERLEKERLEKERLEKERLAAEQAERERLEAERLAAEQKAKIDFFIAPLFGKERRTRDVEESGHTIDRSLCSPLLGVMFGPEFKMSPNFKLAPTFGVAANFEKGSYSSVFAELQANYYPSTDMTSYVGAGIGVWDFSHNDWVAPTLSIQFGRQVWTNAKDDKLYFVGEGRLFLNKADDIQNNYQFWGGLRFVLR